METIFATAEPEPKTNYTFIFIMAAIEILLMLAIFYGERIFLHKSHQDYVREGNDESEGLYG